MSEEAPQEKSNRTPDLSDEQYMEQLFLITQSISVMPGQRDGMPNVTTPPPIRARWAAFMLSLGLRIDPALATHKLVSQAPVAAGNWGPRGLAAMAAMAGGKRGSMNRADMMEVWKQANPGSFDGVANGTMTREDLIAGLPAEMQEALRLAEQLRAQEAGDAE